MPRPTKREKLAAMLQRALVEWWSANRKGECPIVVDAGQLYEAKGWYRTSGSIWNEAPRWDGYGKIASTGNTMATFRSYDTMTACVSRGITIVNDTILDFDVCAKEKQGTK